MSHLTLRQRELVAIGASLASNCIPCIKFHVRKGQEAGLGDEEIREAIEIADTVRRTPAATVLEAATAALGRDRARSQGAQRESACGSDDDLPESNRTAGSPCCGPEAGP